jgi:hypothetical protein
MNWYGWLLTGLWIGVPIGFFLASLCRASHDASVREYRNLPPKRNPVPPSTPTDGSPEREEFEPPPLWLGPTRIPDRPPITQQPSAGRNSRSKP